MWGMHGDVPFKSLERMCSATSIKHFERDLAKVGSQTTINTIRANLGAAEKKRPSQKSINIIRQKYEMLDQWELPE